MAFGAPRLAKAGMQNPGWNALPGRIMGGGCQEKTNAVVYAQAVPPSWKGGALAVSVVEHWAYFSALKMVFERPSVIAAIVTLPCGVVLEGALVEPADWMLNRALPA